MTFALTPRSHSLLLILAFGRRSHAFATAQFASHQYSSTSALHMTRQVLVPIADGSEEIETTCITDTLTRFGAQVTVASVMKDRLVCKMSRGIKIEADCSIEDCTGDKKWDLVVLPGGMPGAEHLRDSTTLMSILKKQKSEGRLFGAVCASPAVALVPNGLLGDEPATCYPAPAFRNTLKEVGSSVSDEAVVVSGNLVTSQGPGTSLLFALQLGEELFGKEKRDEIAKQMLVA